MEDRRQERSDDEDGEQEHVDGLRPREYAAEA
jgi:hypothetical protein